MLGLQTVTSWLFVAGPPQTVTSWLFVCGVGWAGYLLPRRELRSEIKNPLYVNVASLLPPFCLRESRSEIKNQLSLHAASLQPPFCSRESRSEIYLMHISHRTLRICYYEIHYYRIILDIL